MFDKSKTAEIVDYLIKKRFFTYLWVTTFHLLLRSKGRSIVYTIICGLILLLIVGPPKMSYKIESIKKR